MLLLCWIGHVLRRVTFSKVEIECLLRSDNTVLPMVPSSTDRGESTRPGRKPGSFHRSLVVACPLKHVHQPVNLTWAHLMVVLVRLMPEISDVAAVITMSTTPLHRLPQFESRPLYGRTIIKYQGHRQCTHSSILCSASGQPQMPRAVLHIAIFGRLYFMQALGGGRLYVSQACTLGKGKGKQKARGSQPMGPCGLPSEVKSANALS